MSEKPLTVQQINAMSQAKDDADAARETPRRDVSAYVGRTPGAERIGTWLRCDLPGKVEALSRAWTAGHMTDVKAAADDIEGILRSVRRVAQAQLWDNL